MYEIIHWIETTWKGSVFCYFRPSSNRMGSPQSHQGSKKNMSQSLITTYSKNMTDGIWYLLSRMIIVLLVVKHWWADKTIVFGKVVNSNEINNYCTLYWNCACSQLFYKGRKYKYMLNDKNEEMKCFVRLIQYLYMFVFPPMYDWVKSKWSVVWCNMMIKLIMS